MALNTAYIEDSIPKHTRTSLLAQKIRCDLGSYVGQRKYLSPFETSHKLKLMGYGRHIAWELAKYFQECVESAFERGVFIVSCRSVNLEDANVSEPEELITLLKQSGPEYFDPMKWYELRDFEREMKSKSYCDDIVREMSAFFLRHVRAAFAKGINGAAEKLVRG